MTQAQRTRGSSQVKENAKAQEHNAVRNVRTRRWASTELKGGTRGSR